MERLKTLQELQDKYGYVVMGLSKERTIEFKIGDTIPGFASDNGDDVTPSPLMVIGFTTFEEWRAQRIEADGEFNDTWANQYDQFVRLKAE